MTRLLALMFLIFVLPPKFAFAQEQTAYVDTAVVFVADVSTSMDTKERKIVRGSHAQAMVSKELVEIVQDGMLGRSAFAYIEFSTVAVTLVPWRIIDGPMTAEAFADEIERVSNPDEDQLTHIAAGLEEALRLLEAAPFEATREIVDVVGDGPQNIFDIATLRTVRKEILKRGATINGMPMLLKATPVSGYTGLADYYTKEIIGGPAAFLIPLERIEQMPMALRQKLALELF